jgi:hypothetical protein
VTIIHGSKTDTFRLNLAHDIAADYYDHGVGEFDHNSDNGLSSSFPIIVDVTMFQRGSTYIMSVSNGFKVLMGGQFNFLTSIE